MNSSARSPTRVLALLLLLALAACSHGPHVSTAIAPVAQTTSSGDIDAIAQLLDQGEIGSAKKRIAAALVHDPMNPSVQLLRDSIDRDPKELLGPISYAYTTRDGDTMSGLAQRFLGNRLKAYQLARYNGIEKPAALVAGQALRIPGEPPRIESPRQTESRRPPSTPSTSRTRSAPVRTGPAKPAAAAKPAANPAVARQARAAGLAALNAGNVERAVGLLRRAAALDPGNPVIARDLVRAQRIAATVRARK